MNNPDFIFFGTPEFAAQVLQELIEHKLLPKLIICNPDRPQGRKKIITPPPTKEFAQKYNIPVWQPEKLNAEEFLKSARNPDLAVVAAYAKIIPSAILNIPRYGTIGVHPSLLPLYRGPSPIQSAILTGEKKTGVSIYKLDEKVDHGPIYKKETLAIEENDSFPILSKKLSRLGGEMLVDIISNIATLAPQAQDETCATFTKKFTTDDAFISENDLRDAMSEKHETEARMICQKILALNPEPGTWTMHNGKRIKLLESALHDGKLQLRKIQIEGKLPGAYSDNIFKLSS